MLFKNKSNEIRSGWKIFLVFLLTYGLSFIVSIILGIVLAIIGSVTGNTEYLLTGNIASIINSELIFLVSVVLSNCVSIISCIIVWKWLDKKKIREMGVTSIKRGRNEFLVGLGVGAITISIVAVGIICFGNVEFVNPINKPNISLSLIYGLISFVFVGFGEEILSRGYIMSVLKQTRSKWVVLVGPALIFAMLHLANNGISVLAFINLFLVGLLFAYMFMKSKNIWMPIGYHITWNYFQGYIWGFGVSGNDVQGLYKIKNVSDNIINGGAFGPEGGLMVTIIICLTFGFVYWYYKDENIDNFMGIKIKEIIDLK